MTVADNLPVDRHPERRLKASFKLVAWQMKTQTKTPVPGTSQGTSSESIVHVNVKTLDSQISIFEVEKDMLVSLFKEKIADTIGAPVGQQRLIFRGKVLKDEHCLSE